MPEAFDTLEALFKEYKGFVKNRFTFMPCFRYWQKILLEYATRLFSYEGLPESIPAHEIDLIAYMRGYCPLVQIANGGRIDWIAAYSSGMYGLTDYLDMYTNVNFTTPLHYGSREIDKNCILIPNNSLKTPLMMRIDHYATLLSHVDISIIAEMVNDREVDYIDAISQSASEGAAAIYEKRYDGEPSAYVNLGFSQLRHNFIAARAQNQNSTLWDLRSNILSAYLEEIGVKKSMDKRERQITSEIQADDEMLRLNLSDMLECRQLAFKKFEDLSGISVKVSCNVDYKRGEAVDIEKTP